MIIITLIFCRQIHTAITVRHSWEDIPIVIGIISDAEEHTPPVAVHIYFEINDTTILEGEVEIRRGLTSGCASNTGAAVRIENANGFIMCHYTTIDYGHIEILRSGCSLKMSTPSILTIQILCAFSKIIEIINELFLGKKSG